MKTALILAIVCFAGSPMATAQSLQWLSAGQVYRDRCQFCHGPHGRAQTPAAKNMGVPSFGSKAMAGVTDAALARVIAKGGNLMPGYGTQLSKSEIAAMVAYVRQLSQRK